MASQKHNNSAASFPGPNYSPKLANSIHDMPYILAHKSTNLGQFFTLKVGLDLHTGLFFRFISKISFYHTKYSFYLLY